MSKVQELIEAAGARLGRSPDQLRSIVSRLVNDNWLETPDALENLSDAQWSQLAVPVALVAEIRKELQTGVGTRIAEAEGSTQDGYLADNKTLTKAKEPGREMDLTEVSYVPPPSSAIERSLAETIAALVGDGSMSVAERKECVVTLAKLIDAVLHEPHNSAKRRINKSNPRFYARVGQWQSAMGVLKACGFVDTGETVELQTAFISRLTDAHHEMNNLLMSIGLPERLFPYSAAFNPYQPSLVATGGDAEGRVARDKWRRELDSTKTAISEVTRALQTGVTSNEGVLAPMDLDPKAFHISTMKTTPDPSVDDVSSVDEDDHLLDESELTHIRDVLTKGQQFKSRQKQVLENLKKQKVYSKCTLRILFPDNVVLQLNFRPNVSLCEVKETIEQFLSPRLMTPSSPAWELYSTPPPTAVNLGRTLYEEGLVPASMLRFRFQTACAFAGPFLNEKLHMLDGEMI